MRVSWVNIPPSIRKSSNRLSFVRERLLKLPPNEYTRYKTGLFERSRTDKTLNFVSFHPTVNSDKLLLLDALTCCKLVNEPPNQLPDIFVNKLKLIFNVCNFSQFRIFTVGEYISPAQVNLLCDASTNVKFVLFSKLTSLRLLFDTFNATSPVKTCTPSHEFSKLLYDASSVVILTACPNSNTLISQDEQFNDNKDGILIPLTVVIGLLVHFNDVALLLLIFDDILLILLSEISIVESALSFNKIIVVKLLFRITFTVFNNDELLHIKVFRLVLFEMDNAVSKLLLIDNDFIVPSDEGNEDKRLLLILKVLMIAPVSIKLLILLLSRLTIESFFRFETLTVVKRLLPA